VAPLDGQRLRDEEDGGDHHQQPEADQALEHGPPGPADRQHHTAKHGRDHRR